MPLPAVIGVIWHHTAVSRRLPYKRREAYATKSKGIMGDGDLTVP